MIQGGNFSKFSIHFYRTYERGVVDIDITMACDISIYGVFSQLKLFCRDRPAAARRCAFPLLIKQYKLILGAGVESLSKSFSEGDEGNRGMLQCGR